MKKSKNILSLKTHDFFIAMMHAETDGLRSFQLISFCFLANNAIIKNM